MLRKRSDETNPADWFSLATDRLKAADIIWAQGDELVASCIELLQEAVERFLKGYLIARGWRLVKTHDLVVLISEAALRDERFNRFRALCKELTDDFLAQHYPGEDWTEVGQNYEWLREEAGQLVDLIKQSLPEFFPASPP